MRAIVLSGGSVKGAYQLGVLKKWMGEEGRDYQIMTGVSVGALNIAGLSRHPYGSPKDAIDGMIDFWLENVKTSNIYRRWFPFGRLHSLWEKSIYDSRPLMRLVRENFPQDKIKNCGRRLAVGVVSLDTGEHKFVEGTDPQFVEWVLASASFPVFLTPIEINGNLWSDGGIKNVTPLGQAIKMGATEIDVIVTSNIWNDDAWDSTSKRAIPDQALRAVDLMNGQIIRNDIEVTGLKNDLATLGGAYKNVKVRVVAPKTVLVDDSLSFDHDVIIELINAGYKDADSAIDY